MSDALDAGSNESTAEGVERILCACFDELVREYAPALESQIVTVLPRVRSRVHVRASPIDADARFAYAEEERVVLDAVHGRRREFATGRRLAHEILAEMGRAPEPLLSGVRRAPIWPAGAVGSISHARGIAVVAAGPAPPFAAIGVDIESAEVLAPRLIESVLTPREVARYRTLGGDLGAWAKLAFSAKECAYKTWSHALDAVPEFTDVEIEFDTTGTRFVAQLVPRVGTSFQPWVLRGSIARSGSLVLAAAMKSSA